MTGQALQRFALGDDPAKRDWFFCTRKEVDLAKEEALYEWLAEHKVTQVINVAAVVGGITFNMSHPLSTLDQNLRLATSVLGACHRAGIQDVVSILSTCIFPVRHQKAFVESDIFDGEPHHTNGPYAHAKRMLLALSRAYANQHGRNYVCVVPPNLYGPHDKFDEERAHVVGALVRKFAFAEQAAEPGGRTVSIYGSGVARRQFMFCDDLAGLLVWALESYKDAAEPLILADDGDLAIKDLVATIASNFAEDIRLDWDTTKPDGQLQKKALNLKMRRFLPGWKATPIEEGIRRTVAWYRETHGCPEPLAPINLKLRFPLCCNNLPKEDLDVAIELMRSGDQLSMGPETAAFEKEFAAFMGVEESLFVNSGSSANLLAVVAAMHPDRPVGKRLCRGDRVGVPALCWSTTVAPLVTQGLTPVFVDVDPLTLQISLDHLESKAKDLKGLMTVHVLGSCPDMDRLMAIVKDHSLVLIEDSCEAMGNKWKGRRLGTFGDFGTFSTFYSHHMTSIEGGFVLANDPGDRLRLRGMRAHGWIRHLPSDVRETYAESHKDIDPRFLFVDVGFNMRPLDLCAAIGRCQLRRLEETNGFRRANYEAIYNGLNGRKGIRLPSPPGEAEVAYLALPLLFPPGVDLKRVQTALEETGVETRPIISGNFLRQPMMKRWGVETENPATFEGAEAIHRHGIYVGLHGVAWASAYCDALCARILCSME
jgi:CDP-6-deoxy-D-xylo-4-hexulose-3-dehydrase